jgi:A/G-specific adenine glycosylase
VRSPIRTIADAGQETGLVEAVPALLAWYERSGRRLGFRDTRDPWAILVSEVMLQQTQVSRVEAAWANFVARFPTPRDLAGSTTADVVRAWAGLGYNRRALNLQRAARAMCAAHTGRVPSSLDDLQQLPGIGGYTARAVAAIAFGVPVAAIDTNLRRVLGRVLAGHGWPGDPGASLSAAELQQRADRLVERRAPGAWTQALMDVGATICRPRAPDCAACPLSVGCCYAANAAAQAASKALATPVAGVQRERRGPTEGASASAPAVLRPRSAPFPTTTRWLRGRIIDRLRSLDEGGWVRLDVPIGAHGARAVASAIAALERDGLLERRPDGGVRLPSTLR